MDGLFGLFTMNSLVCELESDKANFAMDYSGNTKEIL